MSELTKEGEKIVKDLFAQADYWDMEVDWELLKLVPKSKPKYDPYDYLIDEPELDRFDIHD